MKKSILLTSFLVGSLVLTPFSSIIENNNNVAKAYSTNESNSISINGSNYYNSLSEKEKEKLTLQIAEAFKKIDEEIAIKNNKNEIVNFNMDLLENKINNYTQFNKLKETVKYDNISLTFKASVTECAKNALMDFVGGEALGAMLKGGIVKYFEQKAWYEAAKIAVKFAVKDLSPYMIAGSLAWSFGRCMLGW